MFLLSNQLDFYVVYTSMINALFLCFNREKLGSSSCVHRQLHFTLFGSVSLVMATNLKCYNKFNCPLTSLGIIIFVLQINNLNCSAPSVPRPFNLLCSGLYSSAHVSLLCELSTWKYVNRWILLYNIYNIILLEQLEEATWWLVFI